MSQRSSFIILSPFSLLISFVETVLKTSLRFTAALVGLVIMIAGLVLCVTIIGALAGIPLIVFGFMLMVKGLSI